VSNESPGGGSIDERFAQMLGMPKVPVWGDSTEWQYWVIRTLKQHEQEMGYTPHPVGMTMQFPVRDQTRVNEPLYDSPADWISPGFDDAIFNDGRNPMAPGSPASRWFDDPPAANGQKVVLSDTDHYSSMYSDALWCWKSFMRGHNPILYDLGIVLGANPSDPAAGSPSFLAHEPARHAMGDTLRYAQRVNLVQMEPRGDLSSTRYVLANPGREYLILEPSETAKPFRVTLAVGSYAVEWFSLQHRESWEAECIVVESEAEVCFAAPFTGPSVLYLERKQVEG
jgi:hypothetical protein